MAAESTYRRTPLVAAFVALLAGVGLVAAGLAAQRTAERVRRDGVVADATVHGADPCRGLCLVAPRRLVVALPTEPGDSVVRVPADTPYAVGDTVRVIALADEDGSRVDAVLAAGAPEPWRRHYLLGGPLLALAVGFLGAETVQRRSRSLSPGPGRRARRD